MKVLHTISGMGIKSGGPTTCLYNLILGLHGEKVDAQVLTFQPQIGDSLIIENSFIQAVKQPSENRYGYSTAYKKEFKNNKNVDIIHANGLWQFTTHYSSVYARKNNIPYLISPHGMLYPEGLKTSSLFKKIALPLYQSKDLHLASVLHATSNKEMEYIRNLGFKNPIAIIPNAIDVNIPDIEKNEIRSRKRLGFVGRFAPIKNLENLIIAWADAGKYLEDWELILIGSGDPVYTDVLRQMIKDLKIENIQFTGFLEGERKERVIQELDYLILPSKSENFGMVVTEALARKIPVIASQGTPWEELNSTNSGWWINSSVDSLVDTLKIALSLNENEQKLMGENGRRLVEEKYSIESVGEKFKKLYEWILNRGEKPDFVL